MPSSPAFFVGVNLPWLTYGCDFGANAWQPEGGVGLPDRRRRVDEVLGRLSASGLRTVRWFALCDGRSGIVFDSAGFASGLDPFVFRDFDAALSAAIRHEVRLIFTLFDFLWCAARKVVNGVAIGGRRASVARPEGRVALVERVVRPLLRRYGSHPAVEAWDVFNEPEWATLGYGSVNPARSIWPGSMRALLSSLVDAVHEETHHAATVGLASAAGLPLLMGIDVDVYHVHWYDRLSQFVQDLTGRLEKPLVLGEFPTRGSARNALEIVRGAQERGYCGALAWSALASDEYSELEAMEQAIRSWRG